MPYCEGLGITPQGTYIFSPNVVHEALRLVNQDFCKPPLQEPTALSGGWLTISADDEAVFPRQFFLLRPQPRIQFCDIDLPVRITRDEYPAHCSSAILSMYISVLGFSLSYSTLLPSCPTRIEQLSSARVPAFTMMSSIAARRFTRSTLLFVFM